MVDDLLAWCAANNMYVILDLHAAPGGQGRNADISDYDSSKPSLWESSENKRKTIALWKKLAERYANEKWIGGYDLINETNWGLNGDTNGCNCDNLDLLQLMKDITTAVREKDKNHVLFVEGNCWANNMTNLFPPWDNNMAYSFHKYWNNTDVGTINDFLAWRDQYNVPFWMGESGENSNQWFYETIKMLESQKIGWSWWPMKKINSIVGPLTAIKTPAYQQLLDIWKQGNTPEGNFCYNTMMEIAENLKIENCVFHPDVIDAMFRQQTESSTIPFKKHLVPGTVSCVDFDMGRHFEAYYDTSVKNPNGDGNNAWNQGYAYRNDGVDIEACTDTSKLSNGYNVGWINDREWMQYTTDVKESGAYTVTFRIASTSEAGKFHLELDKKNITGSISAINTSGSQKWADVTVSGVILEKGTRKIRFCADRGGFNLNYFQFSSPTSISSIPAKVLNAYGDDGGKSVYLAINKGFSKTTNPDFNSFRLKVNGFVSPLASCEFDPTDKSKLILRLTERLKTDDQVFLSYTQGNLQSDDGMTISSFSNLPVTTNFSEVHSIPGKIEAERFSENYGWGDYLDYLVDVAHNGKYQITYRIASDNSAGGIIDLELIESGKANLKLHTAPIPYTKGWQNWQNVQRSVDLPKGEYKLRVLVNQREFNLNWMNFDLLSITGIGSIQNNTLPEVKIYPNPARDVVCVNIDGYGYKVWLIRLINANGQTVRQFEIKNTTKSILNLKGIPDGVYLITASGEEHQLTKKLIIGNT